MDASAGEGRGRGRGRGGVPLLPTGLWQSIVSESGGADTDIATTNKTNEALHGHRFDDADEGGRPPASFSSKPKYGSKEVKKGAIPDPTVDWTCVSCSNVNWARRTTCNICNTAKPKAALTEDEIRTGAGGGFNERQERAAATTIEIGADGFDDFGRRAGEKKTDKKAKEAAALARLHGTFGISASSEHVNITTAAALAYDTAGLSDSVNQSDRATAKTSEKRRSRSPAQQRGSAEARDGRRGRTEDRPRDEPPRDGGSRKRSAEDSRESNRRDDKSRDRDRDRDRTRERSRDRGGGYDRH